MRVALVSEHASPLARIGEVDAGGQNVHVAELASGLTRLGHRVVVYTRRDRAELPERVTARGGYDVVHLQAGPQRPLPKDDLWPHMAQFSAELSRQFAAERPDVAHAHFWMSGWATQHAVHAHAIPVLLTYHALGVVKRRHQSAADSSPPERCDVERWLAQTVDGVIATCRDEVSELMAFSPEPDRDRINPDRFAVVPCGVDLGLFTPASGGPADSNPRSLARFRLLSVGRLVPRKGFDDIIAAVSRLPGAELLIAGGPEAHRLDQDPEATRLQRLAVDLGVADRVRLLGGVPRPALPALLRSADVVVCTPWYEPFGIVPLEAMACGVPVIASAVGGLLDTVVPGVTGLHVPPRDAAALARAIQIMHDPVLRRSFGAAATARARRCYSWDSVAARTAEVYRGQLSSHPRGAVPAEAVPVGGPPAHSTRSGW